MRKQQILIVDDNTELLELLCLAVTHAGFRVASATTGPEALAKVRSLKPDLLVLDLILPDMDGFAVCETLRRERAFSTMPIIMLTGLSSEFTRYAGLECGANEFVKKPASPADLVSIIRRCLRISKTGRTAGNALSAAKKAPRRQARLNPAAAAASTKAHLRAQEKSRAC